jgi:uncharacterized membrane protein
LVLGLAWLVCECYVRHVYGMGWITSGSPLKSWGRLGKRVTLIDGRRNVYVWYAVASYVVTGCFAAAIFASLFHSAATAAVYTAMTYRKLGELAIAP